MILLMYEPVREHLQNLQRISGNHAIKWAQTEEQAKDLIREAEIVLGNRFFIQSLPFSKKLRWMQSNSVGVDIILSVKEELKKKDILLTCAKGVYDAELAEHTMALLLSLFRSLHLLRDEQTAHSWQRHRLAGLRDSRCLILGWGSLGKEIARHLKNMGADVSAVRNSEVDGVEDGCQIFGLGNWRNKLGETDALILCLPKTAQTYHYVGKAELEQLPAHAFVVNIGRGGTLDEKALLEQIQKGQLAGAALDVFENEPLPTDNPLWDEPRILISPHVGRSLEGPAFKWQILFEENLRRYLAGEEMLHVVNYDKGY